MVKALSVLRQGERIFEKPGQVSEKIWLISAQKAAKYQKYVVTTIDMARVNRIAYMSSWRSGSEALHDASGLPHSQKKRALRIISLLVGWASAHRSDVGGTAPPYSSRHGTNGNGKEVTSRRCELDFRKTMMFCLANVNDFWEKVK